MTYVAACFTCGDKALWHISLGKCVMPECKCLQYNPKINAPDDVYRLGRYLYSPDGRRLCGKVGSTVTDPCTYLDQHVGKHSWNDYVS